MFSDMLLILILQPSVCSNRISCNHFQCHPFQVLRKSRVQHDLPHNFTPPSTLFTPSLNTYPIATGLVQAPFPASTPTGAFFNLSVKKTGCRFDASNITCRSCVELTGRGVGGMASIWVLGAGGVYVGFALHILEVSDRVGCWFMGVEMDRGGGFVGLKGCKEEIIVLSPSCL